jgi:hypothetical protein
MSYPILYLDRSTIHPGTEVELREAVARLVALVEDQQPQLLAYGFSIDDSSHAMIVSAVHPDSASLERHLAMGGDEFRRVGRYIELESIEVVGPVSDRAVEQLKQKAAALGDGASIHISPVAAGFSRLG